MATCDAPNICESGPVLFVAPIVRNTFTGAKSEGIRFKITPEALAPVIVMGSDLPKSSNLLAMKTLFKDLQDRYATCVNSSDGFDVLLTEGLREALNGMQSGFEEGRFHLAPRSPRKPKEDI